MEHIQQLSPRGVDLYHHQGRLVVQRQCSQHVFDAITQFYQSSTFPYRPKLYTIRHSDNIILEEYITGPPLQDPDRTLSKKLIDTLMLLSGDPQHHEPLLAYLTHTYTQKLATLTLGDTPHQTVEQLFAVFQTLARDDIVPLHRVHGDLNPSNIIIRTDQSILIDRERVKRGHPLEDIQRYIHNTLQYHEQKTNDFVDDLISVYAIDRNIFTLLECFHFFLYLTLQLSKSQLSLETFKRIVSEKIDRREAGKSIGF